MSILDFAAPLDIEALDTLVSTFYTGSGAAQKEAGELLQRFQEHPDAWTRVDAVLERLKLPQSKYLALSILDRLITTRWKALPVEQSTGIRNFLVNMVIALCQEGLAQNRALVHKCDLTLVQILKQEWPQQWPEFVPEIVSSSRSDLSVCENNMVILKLLSEEVFDFGAELMTQARASLLKTQMAQELESIFQLCYEVLEHATKPSLVVATLQCLHGYLHWIPSKYVFETGLLPLLVERFLPATETRTVTLKCLTEAALLVSPQHDAAFSSFFTLSMDKLRAVVPPRTDLKASYASTSSADQEFLADLALYLTSFLLHHLLPMETDAHREVVLAAHEILVDLSRVEERELFKTCLDYWQGFVYGLFQEVQAVPAADTALGRLALAAGGAPDPERLRHLPLRKHMYAEACSRLRRVIIEQMVRPEEVLIVENDEGEIVREFVRESDTITLYKNMREVLVYLTHLDVLDTEQIMSEKLARQIDGSEWLWHNINTLCWAIGSISGTMNEDMEKRFLVQVIKHLLNLTEMARGKDNKAVVALNIMYIVGQYPRFLKAHWKFLKTVVNKLFEFMHETHEGVQDMACDTFIKIVQKCKRHFLVPQPGEEEPFIDEIIRRIPEITADLSPQQVHTFYEACGYIVGAQSATSIRDKLLSELMSIPNFAWRQVVDEAGRNPEMLGDTDRVKIIANIIKTNVAVCRAVGPGFASQLGNVYVDMMLLYTAVLKMISDAVAKDGQIATKHVRVRALRTIKKEILHMVEVYVAEASNKEEVVRNLVPPLFGAILADYKENVPDARDLEVLVCLTAVVLRVGELIPDGVLQVIENVIGTTLAMINTDLSEYPEHRREFFRLLREINVRSFAAECKLPGEVFRQLVLAALWGARHENQDVETDALTFLTDLLKHVDLMARENAAYASAFYQTFYLQILSDTVYVIADSGHQAAFKLQTQLLARLIELVASGAVTVPLYSAGEAPEGTLNADYCRNYLGQILVKNFGQLNTDQVGTFLQALFAAYRDHTKFRGILRDFLIQIKSVGGDPTDYMFAEERGDEREQREREDLARRRNVGGLIKPSEMED